MRGSEFKKEIEKIFKEAREKFPHITDEMLDSDGAIYYMNGNDSTPFDWEVNGRLCEFFIFHKNERGFIKILVGKKNKINIYVYEDGSMRPTYDECISLRSGPAWQFYRLMCHIADDKLLWNKPIDELDWNIEV